MSVYQTYRGLDKLHPRTRKKVQAAMKIIQEQYGDSVFITETRRSNERQKYLFGQWLSKVKRSKHQDWLAVDIAFKDDTRTKQKEKILYPKDYNKRREIADVFASFWLDWWYDLWNRDKPHFQDNGQPFKTPRKDIGDKEKLEALHIIIRSLYTTCEKDTSKEVLAAMSRVVRDSWVSEY